MRTIFLSIAVVLTITFSFAYSALAKKLDHQTGSWFCYEPCIVQLTGTLTTQIKYAQPNYGENPKTDVKGKIYVLVPTKSINVKGNPYGVLDTDSFVSVKEIQLAFDPSKVQLDNYIGKKIKVKGKLFEAITGHNYTNVLMMVIEVTP